MLRLALILGAAIYAGLVVFSEGAPDAPVAATTISRAAAIEAPRPGAAPSAPDSFFTADGRQLRVAAVIDPVALASGQNDIAHVSTRPLEEHADTISVSGSGGLPETILVAVTGNAVNLRAGPSTGDVVLTALVRGEQAELIAAPGNGWVQVRTLPGGTIGYLSARFVAPLD